MNIPYHNMYTSIWTECTFLGSVFVLWMLSYICCFHRLKEHTIPTNCFSNKWVKVQRIRIRIWRNVFQWDEENFLDEGRVCTRKANLMLKGMNISLTEKAILVHFLTTYKIYNIESKYIHFNWYYIKYSARKTPIFVEWVFFGSGIWRAQFKSRTCVWDVKRGGLSLEKGLNSKILYNTRDSYVLIFFDMYTRRLYMNMNVHSISTPFIYIVCC